MSARKAVPVTLSAAERKTLKMRVRAPRPRTGTGCALAAETVVAARSGVDATR